MLGKLLLFAWVKCRCVPSCMFSRGDSKRSSRRRVISTTLFALCTVLLFADQNLMSPNLTAIARDFGFDDRQRDQKLAGDIAFAFWVLGAPASIVVGSLADSWNRARLFAVTVWVGEGACLATAFATTYSQLYWCRTLTGFSLGGAMPLIYSIMGDLFAAHERHVASALVTLGTGCGTVLGQGLAGYLGPKRGWRLPFVVISIPALLCAALVYCCVEDPERGSMEQAVKEHHLDQQQGKDEKEDQSNKNPINSDSNATKGLKGAKEGVVIPVVGAEYKRNLKACWSSFGMLLRTPSVVLLVLQGVPGCVPWGVVNSYLNDYLAENRGMSVERATSALIMFGFGKMGGLAFGGASGRYLYQVDVRYPQILSGIMAVVGCFPLWAMLNGMDGTSSAWRVGTISAVAGFCATITGPIGNATMQNVTLPRTRGLAFALHRTFDDFGQGLGPVCIAMLIARLGRTEAFNWAVSFWIVCGMLNGALFWTVKQDEQRVQVVIRAKLKKEEASLLDA